MKAFRYYLRVTSGDLIVLPTKGATGYNLKDSFMHLSRTLSSLILSNNGSLMDKSGHISLISSTILSCKTLFMSSIELISNYCSVLSS